MAGTSNCNYRLIPIDGYSAHCGHSSFDNVDEVSHLVTCKTIVVPAFTYAQWECII